MGARGRRVSDELSRIICEQYRNGIPLKEIASKSQISQSTVMAILRRNGVELRNRKQITPIQEDSVVKMYRSGASIANIKSETGVKSEQTIYRILNDAGVEKRKKR